MTAAGRDHGAAFDRVLELAVFLGEDMSHGLAALGLTRSRTEVLWVLHRGGPSTQRTLADALGVSPRNVTGLVDALVATGFVTREPHPTDRRAALVTLTEHGARTTAALDRDHEELARALFADMPAERFECFVTGLEQVLAGLRERAAAAGGRR
jgi:DNA-binding MarR family transcriptional regulator